MNNKFFISFIKFNTMNKNSKLMIIYDDNNHKSNLNENNIIYWNDYAHGDESILNLIEKIPQL